MVKAGEAKFGPVDILVNNAGGIFNMTLFAEKTDAEILKDINLNLIGPMNCIRAVIKPMLARKSGKIISVASIGANKGIPYTTVYNACKAGIVSMTKSLAVDYGPQGINVNCISPGLGLTKFGGAPPPPEIMKEALSMTPARRTTTPQDMANTVVYLASDMSTDIMGQNLAVDGGTNVI
jgi:3-oxoacyl-[acyl-carrier protein] reductase